MGDNKRIIKKKVIPIPRLNQRLTVELCENVHLHYRNLRLEFSKDEFLFIVKLIKGLDEKVIKDFVYDKGNFNELIKTVDLPPCTEFNDRLQIEELMDGSFHVHYRNLRLDFENLEELGLCLKQIYFQ